MKNKYDKTKARSNTRNTIESVLTCRPGSGAQLYSDSESPKFHKN